jgi:cephalosporin hydroxylase
MLQAVKRPVKDWVREKFHRIFYNSKIWKEVHWLGVPVLKCPFDLWTYQQILWETRPTLIVECGTNRGGSAFFFATLFDLMQDGRVITIDVNDMKPPAHPRVKYILGSSADPKVRDLIKAEMRPNERVMVSLDSDHSTQHVLKELDAFSSLVTPGCYLVVEDTNVNGHPVVPEHGSGPWEAVEQWLPQHPEFEQDFARERFGFSFNTHGWLRRRSNGK